jgi:hypothetical protein
MAKNTAKTQEPVTQASEPKVTEEQPKNPDGHTHADILERLQKLEDAVYKPNDKPVQALGKRNYNTDPGPFARGTGVSNIK